MGIVTAGIPEEIVIDLARLTDARVFVETGTYQGATARWAAERFSAVHTVERARTLYDAHSCVLRQIRGISPYLGDSREVLPTIVASLGNQRAVFWLDGHWSGGETAGEHDECPVLDELACLSGRAGDIILIDDARLFLCAPPLPHKASQWPTIVEIVRTLGTFVSQPFVQIVDDVVFIVPNEAPARSHLVAYAQRRAGQFWQKFADLHREAGI
jgi:hypothetical protein